MKKVVIGVIAIAIVVIALLVGNTPNTPGSLVIGSINGLTGEYAVVGESWGKGLKLAYEQYQEAHPDIKIILVEEDSEFNTAKGVSAFRKLEDVHNIDALINMDSFTINGIYDLVIERDYPVLQGGEQSIEPADDNVFQIMQGNIAAEVALGEYVKERGYENIALFYTQETTYERFADAFKEGYGQDLQEYPIAASERRDVRTNVSKALQSDLDAIVLILIPEQGALVAGEILNQTTTPPVFVFDANFHTGFEDYKRLLGSRFSDLEGAVTVKIISKMRDEFRHAYTERWGVEPSVFADLGYDAFNVLLASYDSDGTRWIENVRIYTGEGAGGKIEFDDVGVRLPNFEIVQVQNGEI